MLGRYKHYKGAEVEVTGIATHSESLEDMVIYRHLETEEVWVRPKTMFLEEVEVDGVRQPRFKKIS